jgi:hypothetical protein
VNWERGKGRGSYEPRPLAIYLNCKVAILSALNIVNQGSPLGASVIPNGSLPFTTLDVAVISPVG